MLSSLGERSSPTCGPPTPLSVTQIGLPFVHARRSRTSSSSPTAPGSSAAPPRLEYWCWAKTPALQTTSSGRPSKNSEIEVPYLRAFFRPASSPTTICWPGLELRAHRAGELGVDGGRQRLRRALALLALRADEERAVGLVPRAPPVDVDALALGQVLQRADQLLVASQALGVDRARARGDAVALAAVRGRGGPVGHAVDDDHRREAVARLLLGADRAQRVADAVVRAAGLHAAHAAVGGLGPVDRAVALGLQRGPVDGEAVERRLERLEAVAPRREGADVLAVPEEVGIDLGHPDGQAAARRDVGRRRLGRRRLGGVGVDADVDVLWSLPPQAPRATAAARRAAAIAQPH